MSRLKKREVWKVYPRNENYEISNMGRIRRAIDSLPCGNGTIAYKKGKVLKTYINRTGYVTQILSYSNRKNKTQPIHRLVLETFIGPCPKGHECNHKDGNKLNNKLINLEWITHSENMKHAHINRTELPAIKLKEGEVWLIKKILQSSLFKRKKIRIHQIAKMFKVPYKMAAKIKTEISTELAKKDLSQMSFYFEQH